MLIGLFSLAACKKSDFAQTSVPIAAPQNNKDDAPVNVYYTNSSDAMYVVGFINIDTKKVFTTVVLPSSKPAKLILPGILTSGYYNVVITPEQAYSAVTTRYTIADVSGSSNQYPATIKRVYLTMNTVGEAPVSIALH